MIASAAKPRITACKRAIGYTYTNSGSRDGGIDRSFSLHQLPPAALAVDCIELRHRGRTRLRRDHADAPRLYRDCADRRRTPGGRGSALGDGGQPRVPRIAENL